MAESLQDPVCAATLDGTKKMNLCVDVQTKISQLKDVDFYENLFSWKLRNSCNSTDEPIKFKTLDKSRKSSEKHARMVTFKDGLEEFDVHK